MGGLHLPINLAFFLHSSPAGRVVAFYPSPAGATESLVELDAWKPLGGRQIPSSANWSRTWRRCWSTASARRATYYRVGIDLCYHLAGLIRTHWRGLSGGTAVWDEIGRFFAGLKERSGPAAGDAHA